MATTKRALAKVTLGWNQVYEYELCVMDHGAGVDVVLGTDFMIPAGVRLDLFHATARLPDEVEIPLIKTQRMTATRAEGPHVPDGPTEVLTIPGHESRDYRPMRQPPTNETHELWFWKTNELILKVVEFQRGVPRRVRVTNISERLVTCPVHLPLLLWVPRGDLPRTEGYVRLGSDKYNEWRVLAYSRSRDLDLYKTEGEIYKRWLATQSSAVERVPYTTPTQILRRPSEFSESSMSDRRDQAEVSEGSDVAQLKLEGAYLAVATVSEDWRDRDAPNTAENAGNAIEFNDYARELAVGQQDRVVKVLNSHELIMISSRNALSPPAYGVVCDIDVQGHPPIKQKARRIPLRHLKQLYELLKGLLKAGPIAFSDSPWASPIVIVLKTNGVDIRLCIDYKFVNSVAAIMEYAMPLVDDLLTDLEKYMWYCSLGAASGFCAVMMTQRAQKISAFVCALGHFEWLRMPFGSKNTTMINPRAIANQLGFVQPRGGWSACAERVRKADAADTAVGGSPTDTATLSRTRFEADRESSDIADSLSAVLNDSRRDMFASGEADQSSLVPVFERRSFVDDICFSGESFDPCLETLDRLLSRFDECRVSILWRLPGWKIEIAARAYFESTTVNQAECMDMNEDLRAAQAYGVTDLVVIGDSRLAIQQSLGVIPCLKESLLTQLNIHRELVASFQPVRYLHVTLKYNTWADSLAGETLAAMEAKTTLTEESKNKLELNRIHEVTYGEQSRELTQTAKKRVRFAESHDEDTEALPVQPEPPDRPNDVTTESAHAENGKISPGAAEGPPSAKDVDPLEVQEERRRRVDRGQDEELRLDQPQDGVKGRKLESGI
ncbi:unnamed protein product [Phytophthora fragariaefolia]|uniref:Unnamed protein product n=1 Tax=Phytophthora fragariaefolia TaxID=1490495 RepID=A0A9W6TKD1_9STRA|nr:unnamed protein product [Phytophthora fragariaefolia]